MSLVLRLSFTYTRHSASLDWPKLSLHSLGMCSPAARKAFARKVSCFCCFCLSQGFPLRREHAPGRGQLVGKGWGGVVFGQLFFHILSYNSCKINANTGGNHLSRKKPFFYLNNPNKNNLIELQIYWLAGDQSTHFAEWQCQLHPNCLKEHLSHKLGLAVFSLFFFLTWLFAWVVTLRFLQYLWDTEFKLA